MSADISIIDRAKRVLGSRVRDKGELGYFLDGKPINSIKLIMIVKDMEKSLNE